MTTTPPVRRGAAAGPPGSVGTVPWWSPAVLPGRWTAVAAAVVAFLLVAHLAVTALRISLGDFPGRDPAVRFFALNEEMGLPSWFSSTLLLLTAVSAWLLADVDARSVDRARWAPHGRGVALVFVYLSIDEAAALHEQTIAPLRSALDLGGALFFAWVVLYVPVAAVVALLLLSWVRHLPAVAARMVVAAGVLYVGGAVGVEMVGAVLWTEGYVDTMPYAVVVAVEEGLEMLGALLALSTLTWLRTHRAP